MTDRRRVLGDKLRQLGYNASLANGDGVDIAQNGWTHYLAREEAESLAGSMLPHPVNLHDYASRGGLNLWYDFVSGMEGYIVYFGDHRFGQIVECRFGPVVWSSEPQWTFKVDFGNGQARWIRDFRRAENSDSGKWHCQRGDSVKISELLAAVQKVADDHYDGHWSLFSFTTGFKAAFGTPMYDFGEVVWNIEASSTVEDALRKLLEQNSSLWRLDNKNER